MRRSMYAVAIATLVLSRPAFAQADWVKDLLLAAQLPIVALEARNDGIPNSDIGSILEAIRRAGLPAREATLILDTTRVLHREHGPADNIGAFVQAQLAAGKRGRDLAAAIRAEHKRTGKGRGNTSARGAGNDQGNRGRGNAAPGSGNPSAGRGNAAAGRGNAAGRGTGADSAGRGRAGNRGKPPLTH